MKRLATVPLTLLAVWTLYALKANVWFRAYPAVVVAAFFAAFAASLLSPVPLCERVARARGVALDERGVRYCRAATVAWTAFLAAHLAATVATLFAPPKIWAFYNGFLAYVLIGAMALGEFLFRRRAQRG